MSPAIRPHDLRDWFNGQGDRAPGQVMPPIRQTHISAPYVSTAPNHPMFISISVILAE